MSNSRIGSKRKIRRSERVKITLSATGLKRHSLFKIGSPFAIVTQLSTNTLGTSSSSDSSPGDNVNEHAILGGRTETIQNTRSPLWTKYFILDYELGKEVFINVSIYDADSKGEKMGWAELELGSILGKSRNRSSIPMPRGFKGRLIVHVAPFPEETRNSNRKVKMSLSANLQQKSKASSFYEIHRRDHFRSGSLWHPIFRSDIVNKDDDPDWAECSIVISDLVMQHDDQSELEASRKFNASLTKNPDPLKTPLLIRVWDHNKRTRNKLLGTIETDLESIVHVCEKGNKEFKLSKEDKVLESIVKINSVQIMGETANTNAGENDRKSWSSSSFSSITEMLPCEPSSFCGNPNTVVYEPRSLQKSFTFVDYICGGCELDLMVAVDFSSSNGVSREDQREEYEKAIIAIGDIVTRYDTDKMYPVWGFGKEFEGVVRHLFQVGNSDKVSGLSGILEAYKSTFDMGESVSEPVVLTQVMQQAAKSAKSNLQEALNKNMMSYSILVILTNGNVESVAKTKQKLRQISDAPLSVIIIGIGENSFVDMDELDDFQEEEGGRDICNFVAFDSTRNRSEFTRAALNEVQDQLVSYFSIRDMPPQHPPTALSSNSYDEDEHRDVRKDDNTSNIAPHINHCFVEGYDELQIENKEFNPHKAVYNFDNDGNETIEVFAPPGELGVVINPMHDQFVVHAVKDSSVLADDLKMGDKLIALDGEDTNLMSEKKVKKLISSKADNPVRHMVFLRRHTLVNTSLDSQGDIG